MENGEIPENANEHCPGPQSESAGNSDACDGCPNQQVCASVALLLKAPTLKGIPPGNDESLSMRRIVTNSTYKVDALIKRLPCLLEKRKLLSWSTKVETQSLPVRSIKPFLVLTRISRTIYSINPIFPVVLSMFSAFPTLLFSCLAEAYTCDNLSLLVDSSLLHGDNVFAILNALLADLVAIAERMATVKHKILVLSGKGWAMDFQVGLLDIDICGPSIPKMLGLEGQEIHQSNLGWSPVYVESNLGVMSIGFMLPNSDEPVIWRGPRKTALIKQFLKDVDWGELDFLVVDAPPRTSDEHISIGQFLQAAGLDGAIIVTTPQQMFLIDVRKEVNFCKKVGIQVLGIIENMSSLCQPLSDFKFLRMTGTGEQRDETEWAMKYIREKAPELLNLAACSEVFDSSGGGATKMCNDMGVPFLGKVPLDPQLCKAAEEGRSCFTDTKCGMSAPALKRIIDNLVSRQMISRTANGA
ncbi:unnamed protein product [Ilex paraguariensis]|uniref:Cytosolic Fe-S cluster assembly factor NBP35 n=1 Tax=Ilex paraguariensis TaxID=185542 RepID=A0ABC8SWZ2_9AQUA